ncbi:arylsulfatase D [Paramormyrops kingsleyae]|uniref:Arylsulfatase D n=1 Tax=Paramormyrops kingsleyae TaxID=1676925 RepID=A0A3B3QBJ7_9TELE|nr:arylsulfatase D-like isoform X2 [Paramormyrops kingsleyae]
MECLQNQKYRCCVLVLVLFAIRWTSGAKDDDKPNFVLIMVDDLGIGDVGCYGNDTIRTPNIDRLAQEGVKLTQHIAAAPLCTPSRTAFLTGRYALRSGLGSTGRVQVIMFLGGAGGLPSNETTFAKILQKQGYTTGIVGKWHLGVNCESRNDHCHHPNNHGFDYYYGLPFTNFNDCKPGEGTVLLADLQVVLWNVSMLLGLAILTLEGVWLLGLLEVNQKLVVMLMLICFLALAVWYVPFKHLQTWNCIIMRNELVVEQPIILDTLTHRIVNEAEQFLERNQQNPFLLFLSLVHVHTPLFMSESFVGKSKHGLYGDNVEEADWMIGRIVETVEKLNLSRKTLIYFTSDHGGHIEVSDRRGQSGGWNGIYKGGKAMGGWEGGIRVPGLFRWPGRLPAGGVIDEPTSLMDVFPTVVGLAGGELPRDRVLDGHDLMPLMEGQARRSKHEFMFHYCGVYLNAVRWHPPDSDAVFKVHFFTPNFWPSGAGGCYDTKLCLCHEGFVTQHTPPLLFDLAQDPSESRPLTPDLEPRYAEVLERVRLAVEEHGRTLSPVPNQLTWRNVLWRPWLQPCCGTFPFCSCSEPNVTMTRGS